jgi:hypothetical protein
MQSRRGRPVPSGAVGDRGAVHVQSPGDHPPAEDLPDAPGGREAAPSAADSQVALPAPATPGQLPPEQIPPDRPEAREPAVPPPPVPAELPKRKADPSRPSVPTSRPRWPGSAPATGSADRSSSPEPAGDSSPPEPSGAEPSRAEPSPPPLPPALFHPLWWQERPSPAEMGRPVGASSPSAEPGPPGPSPSDPPPGQPSWATVLVTTVRLWLQRRLAWTRRLWPAQARWRVVIAAGLVAVVFAAGAATVALSRSGRARQAAPPVAGAPTAAAALAGAAAVASALDSYCRLTAPPAPGGTSARDRPARGQDRR